LSYVTAVVQAQGRVAGQLADMPTRRMVNWPSESEVISPTSQVTHLSLSDLLTTACKDRFTTTSTAARTCLTDAHDVETHESARLSSE